ncbi:hypothetical protein KVR01_005789 [Diaporthe batatas]|uniref:uncharacterized protein n=1 Tax=Diaporthe batatas TaxID=748121 RepID=UPI001D04A52E|nr:uncharacterized protein KVR01_005789 [Diaporthe batatas]KAG8163871.1 hypothetical protein KVR01_005789 [Diaporthe batatas]
MITGDENDSATTRRQTVYRLLHNSLVGENVFRNYLSFAENKCILTAVTAILFDQESSTRGSIPSQMVQTTDPAPLQSLTPLSALTVSSQSGRRMINSLIEHMLLIDYNIEERPLRPLDPEPAWITHYMSRVVCHGVCKRLVQFTDECRNGKDIPYRRLAWMDTLIQRYEDSTVADDYSDIGLMLYFFWTRRREITREEYLAGMTGYTGVLHEMLCEIPVVGKDRVIRKLSVDVHKLIPHCVHDESSRTQLISKARWMARELEIEIQVPQFAFSGLSRPGTTRAGGSASNVHRQTVRSNNNNDDDRDDRDDRDYDQRSAASVETLPPTYEEAVMENMSL